MDRIFYNKKTGHIIQIIAIKKGEYENDFDKLMDSDGDTWFPEELERVKSEITSSVQHKELQFL